MRAAPDSRTRQRLRSAVLRWYGTHGRKLPWRGEVDPYTVLVSEIMLQQTQVPRVLVKLPVFLEAFPSLGQLAAAEQRAVVNAWRGMGYNNRAVRLHRLAKAVVEKHGGRLPQDAGALRTLPGIGRYTSHAILAFACRQTVPVVDVNIRRLLSRLFWRMPDTASVRPEDDVWDMAEALVPEKTAYDWNQALMDIGAAICTARSPRCKECPVAAFCRSAHRMKPPAPTERRREPTRFGVPIRVHRGRVVEALRGRKRALSFTTLGPLLSPRFSAADMPWLTKLLRALEQDGLVKVSEEESSHPRVQLA